MNATQLLEVANKVFVNWEHEEKQEANKRMKAKMSLLAAAPGKPEPTQKSALSWKGRLSRKPHAKKTNVPIARRLATVKMNAPTARGQHQSLTKLRKKTGW
jgi:hypothetical protein